MLSKPRLSLLMGIVLISIFPVIVRLNLTPGLISAFYRMAIAAILVLPYAIWKKQIKFYDIKTMFLIVVCGLLFGSDIAVWNHAIQTSSATQASLLTNLAPVWVGVGSYFFLENKPTVNFWIGTFFALVGMIVLMGLEMFIELKLDLAFFLGVFSGMLYAGYIVISKRVLDTVSVLPFMCYSLLVSSVFLGIVNMGFGSSFTGFTTLGWSSLLFQGVFCQLIAWFLISYSTQHMRATRVSLSLLSQAVLAGLLAYIFLGEHITLQMLGGGLIILVGISITFIDKPILGSKRNDMQNI